MDWRAKVELFEEIRREYEFGVGTVLGVAKKLGVHRRMVREALGNAVPSRRKKPERKRPVGSRRSWFHRRHFGIGSSGAAQAAAHGASDSQRLRSELPGCAVAESTIRRYVREKKQHWD